MSRTTYIHGIPQNEYADRSKFVPQQRVINYGKLTVGETRIALAAEQARILAGFYPDMPEFLKGAEALENILHGGLHQGLHLALGTPDFVRRAIGQSRGKTAPEGGAMWSGIQGRAGIGESPLIPYDDCDAMMTKIPNYYSQIPDDYTLEDNANSMACRSRNGEIVTMNKYLEPSAHHILYEYLQNVNEQPTQVITKSVLHRNGVSAISRTFSFDRENLALWLRNGVMRNNTKQGIAPLQPEETILAFSQANSQNISGIGVEPVSTLLATVKIISGIITAIIGAASATLTLLASMKAMRSNEVKAAAQGIGTPTYGPEKTDWPAGYNPNNLQTTTESSLLSNDKLPLLLGAGALGLIMLNNNGK